MAEFETRIAAALADIADRLAELAQQLSALAEQIKAERRPNGAALAQ